MHVAAEHKDELVRHAKAGTGSLYRPVAALTRAVISESELEHWDVVDPPDYPGWCVPDAGADSLTLAREAYCSPDSPLRQRMSGVDAGTAPLGPSFLSDHRRAMDACRHPDHLSQSSLLSNYGLGPRAVQLWPIFSHCKQPLFSDLLVTPLEQYETEVGPDPAWQDKAR